MLLGEYFYEIIPYFNGNRLITMELDRYTDQEIARAILRRDTFITKEYLYRKCYPMFKAIYDKYYTDCENTIELINEIYVYILMPHRETHRSKLQDFGFTVSDNLLPTISLF